MKDTIRLMSRKHKAIFVIAIHVVFLLISPRNCATLFLLYLPSLEQLKYRYADCKSVSLQTFRDSITKSADSTASGIMTQNGYYGRPLSVA